ncbi:MAG: S41 family peptidase [Verrucomicrobiae bacterium]|nr:S41 family peptidase [Verrucomicrobiae bacterium]
MDKFKSLCIKTIALIILLELNLHPAEQKPKFNEIFDLIKQKLTVTTPQQLEDAALSGILARYSNLVQITSSNTPTQTTAPIKKSTILETNLAYFHIQQINQDLPEQFKNTLSALEKTNTLNGLIIDLRFASGNDYNAASQFINLFIPQEKDLFSIGDHVYKSTPKNNPIELLTIILINKQTACAAEVIAEILRQNKLSILIGGKTSATAYSFEEIKLSTGQTLKIANGLIKTSDNTIISTNGVSPDIAVDITLDEEREFLDNPYKLPKRLSTDSQDQSIARISRTKINEAELVRMKREGTDSSGDLPAERDKTPKKTQQQEPQIIHDPVLARAIDLLKVLINFDITRLQKQ